MLVLFLSIIILIDFNNKANPVLLNYAKEVAILKSKYVITSTVKEKFVNKNINYQNLMITNENKAGEIITIDFDNQKINELLIDITDNLIVNLKDIEDGSFSNSKEVYYVPFGIVTRLPSLYWIGPKIPIKIKIIGSLDTNIITTVKNYGINNVLLEIKVMVSVNIRILLPFITDRINTIVEIPVITKIIQGKIPQYYGGIYTNGSNIYSQKVE